MVEQFVFWLLGIIEDDPLPDEVKCILFNTRINGNYKYIELKGYEKEPNINAVAFSPLEAQFFYSFTLAKMQNENFVYNAKYIINEAFSNKELKYIFKKCKIYFKYLNNINYLFTV